MADQSAGVPAPQLFRVHHLQQAKERGEPLTMLTAYDGVSGRIFDEAGIDLLLVGDSIGDNMLGHPSTIPVTVEEMLPAVRAVSRAARRALVIADLPFGSYESSPAQCHATAVRMFKEGLAQAVKFEGGAHLADHVRLCASSGIPVVGHLGFTPQAENMLGGKRVQGRGDEAAERLVADARALEEAGAVAVVLEDGARARRTPGHRGAAHPDHRDRGGTGRGRPGARVDGHGGDGRMVAALREALRQRG